MKMSNIEWETRYDWWYCNDDIFKNGVNSNLELHPYFYLHMKHDKLLRFHKLFDPIV